MYKNYFQNKFGGLKKVLTFVPALQFSQGIRLSQFFEVFVAANPKNLHGFSVKQGF